MHELLLGIRAKIERADESIKNLNAEIAAFVGSDPPPYAVTYELQDDSTQYVFLARSVRDVPLRFAVLAGEIIHQLASSLDYLFCALVSVNGKTVEKRHFFPIYTAQKELRKACDKGAIDDISVSAQEIIRSVQPCTTPTPRDTILAVVKELNGIDKHRLPLVLATVGTTGREINLGGTGADINGNIPAIVGFGSAKPVEIGKQKTEFFRVKLATPTPDFYAKTDFTAKIAFAQCGLAKLVPLTDILPAMLAGVVHTINLFHSEFDANNS